MADQEFDIMSQFMEQSEDTTPVKQTRTNLGVVRNPLLLTYTQPPILNLQQQQQQQAQSAPPPTSRKLNLPRAIIQQRQRQQQQQQQILRGPRQTQPIIMPPTFERPFPETGTAPFEYYNVPNVNKNLDLLPVFSEPSRIVPNQGTIVNSTMFPVSNFRTKINKNTVINKNNTVDEINKVLSQFRSLLISQERNPDINFKPSIEQLDIAISSGISKEQKIDHYNTAYELYEQAYNFLLGNVITNDPSKLKNFTNTTNELEQVKEYNAFILYLTSQKVKIPLNEIPQNIIKILPETVKASIESYNLYIEIPSALRTFDYDVKTLLLSNVPKSKPLTTIKPPAGYSTVGGTSFFKKIPSKIKSRNDNILGDYKITGSSSTINISNNDNQQFVVTQNNNKKIFNDPNEAQRFALLGAFDGDKVNKYRSTLTYENKLKPAFRVIPKAIF